MAVPIININRASDADIARRSRREMGIFYAVLLPVLTAGFAVFIVAAGNFWLWLPWYVWIALIQGHLAVSLAFQLLCPGPEWPRRVVIIGLAIAWLWLLLSVLPWMLPYYCGGTPPWRLKTLVLDKKFQFAAPGFSYSGPLAMDLVPQSRQFTRWQVGPQQWVEYADFSDVPSGSGGKDVDVFLKLVAKEGKKIGANLNWQWDGHFHSAEDRARTTDGVVIPGVWRKYFITGKTVIMLEAHTPPHHTEPNAAARHFFNSLERMLEFSYH